MNKKIRFYSVNYQPPVKPTWAQTPVIKPISPQTPVIIKQSWADWFRSWLINSQAPVKQSWSDWFKSWTKK
jgi:hypothetical protein